MKNSDHSDKFITSDDDFEITSLGVDDDQETGVVREGDLIDGEDSIKFLGRLEDSEDA